MLAGQESASASADLSAQKEAARLRREAARREEEDEKREDEQGRRELVETIGSSRGDADAAAREGMKKVLLKKSTARRTAAKLATAATNGGGDLFRSGNNGSAPPQASSDPLGYTIKGLKPIVEPETERPYDAFGGLVPLALQPPQYHVLRDSYENPWLDRARSDPVTLAGGYDLREYYARAMVEAFSGLGCFVGDEKSHVQAQATGSEKELAATIGTVRAAEAAGGT